MIVQGRYGGVRESSLPCQDPAKDPGDQMYIVAAQLQDLRPLGQGACGKTVSNCRRCLVASHGSSHFHMVSC